MITEYMYQKLEKAETVFGKNKMQPLKKKRKRMQSKKSEVSGNEQYDNFLRKSGIRLDCIVVQTK